MRFSKAVICAALALAVSMPVAAQQQDESNPFEAILNFLRGIFTAGEEQAQTPAQKPAEPAQQSPAAGEPRQAAKEASSSYQPDPVRASPVAQTSLSLHAVVAKGDFEGARKLVEQGADPEAKDPATGASVLHYAVMRGNPEILKWLLARGVNVNSRTKNGTTPLHTAVVYNRYEVAEMLLNGGAEIDAKSASGATPLAIASAAKNRTIAELLRSRGAK
jgi:hypothetical protein